MKEYILFIALTILAYLYTKLMNWLNEYWDDVINPKEDNTKGGDNN